MRKNISLSRNTFWDNNSIAIGNIDNSPNNLTKLSLENTNWRPFVFVSLMVSQKIWDDRCTANEYFSTVYPFFEK